MSIAQFLELWCDAKASGIDPAAAARMPPECRPGTAAKHRLVSACNFPATVCLVFRRAAYDALWVLDLNATFAEHRGQPWGEAWLVDSFRNHEEDVCPT